MFVESYERLNILCNIGPRNKTKFNVRKEDKIKFDLCMYLHVMINPWLRNVGSRDKRIDLLVYY